MNSAAMLGSVAFAVIATLAGHPGLGALTCIIGGALCIAVIYRRDHP